MTPVFFRGSTAPGNDAGTSFSTKEHSVLQAEKVMIFHEKGSFFTFSR
jgi:hypothetical protein